MLRQFRFRKDVESGAVLVEAAVVLPFFILLCAFIFNFVVSLREQTRVLQLAKLTARTIACAQPQNANTCLPQPGDPAFDKDVVFQNAATELGVDPSHYVFNATEDKQAASTARNIWFYRVEIKRTGTFNLVSSSFGFKPAAKVEFMLEPPKNVFN